VQALGVSWIDLPRSGLDGNRVSDPLTGSSVFAHASLVTNIQVFLQL